MGKYEKIYKILKCPTNVPINDMDAWEMYPKHRWVYNKLELAIYQNIPCAPMPIKPKKYPVISKPITNLYGMGLNMEKLNNLDDFYDHWHSNNFWMEYLGGRHESWDIMILNGKIVYHVCFLGHKDKKIIGKFRYWESVDKCIPDSVLTLVREHFKDFMGCLNIETIGCKIIECHLRMGDIDQFPTLDLLRGVIQLYQGIDYEWDKLKLEKIYFFPIWGKEKTSRRVFKYLDRYIIDKLENSSNIHESKVDNPTLGHPKGCQRLMWFTCSDKNYGKNMVKSILNDINDVFSSKRS